MGMLVNNSVATAARRRLLRMHHESGVGHIGGNLSAIDSLLVLFHECLGSADKFILSKGHAAGALYIALWSSGRLDAARLASFHKDDTLLPGHPPTTGHDDILFATGSLGHGLSLAAGTAFAQILRKKNHAGLPHVYCLTSDGEWQEGSTWEGLIFACHHKLANLTVLVDHNGLQGFGTTTEVASMVPLGNRLRGFGAVVSEIDGHNLDAIRSACMARVDGVHVVIMNTVKGKGVSFMEDRMEWHYLPIDAARLEAALAELEE